MKDKGDKGKETREKMGKERREKEVGVNRMKTRRKGRKGEAKGKGGRSEVERGRQKINEGGEVEDRESEKGFECIQREGEKGDIRKR